MNTTFPQQTTRTNFSAKLSFGEEGEHLVGELLMDHGFSILPLYQFSASIVPKVHSSSGSFTSPDLMIYKHGQSMFCEVKRKNKWVIWDNKKETGLNYNHYLQYKQLSEQTNIPCVLFFVHENQDNTKEIYFTSLNNTSSRLLERNSYYNGPTLILFTSESLQRVG